MADIGGFVREVLGVGVVVSALLGIAAFLGRSQIAHWLNKDIERIKSQYQAELESQKASHMQALEAYKVSLIAEAERSKAQQAVKTAAAVKFAEHQFTALSEIHQALVGISFEVLKIYHLALGLEQVLDADKWVRYLSNWEDISNKVLSFRNCVFSGSIYMLDEDVKVLYTFESKMQGVLSLAHDMRVTSLQLHSLTINPEQVEDFKMLESVADRIAYVKRYESDAMTVLKRNTERYLKMQSS